MLPELKGKMFEPLTYAPLPPRRMEKIYAAVALLLAIVFAATGGDQADAVTHDAMRKEARIGFGAPCPDFDEHRRPLRASVDEYPAPRCYYGRDR